MEFERRKFTRLHPMKKLAVSFTSGDAPVQGRIYNISGHGLSVEYEATGRLVVDEEIAISLSAVVGGISKVVTIPCKPVYDIPTLAHDQNFSGTQMRQCGLVYGNIALDRRTQLDRLLAWLAV